MYKQLLILGLGILVGCNQKNDQNKNQKTEDISTSKESETIKRDTLIPINNHVDLYFRAYDNEFDLWKLPQFIKNKKDTLEIKNWDEEWGSELDIQISDNEQYIIIDAIIKGMVSDGENSELHENYTCQLIDVTSSSVLNSFQQACDGEWKNNQWISNGQVEFDGSNYTNPHIDGIYKAIDCENSRFSIQINNKSFKILDQNKVISKGILNMDNSEMPYTINFKNIEGLYYGDSIVIQNYKNSNKESRNFTQCSKESLCFKKNK